MRSFFGSRLVLGSLSLLLVPSGFACSGSEPNAETSAAGSGTGGHSGSAPSAAGTTSASAGSGQGGAAISGGAGATTAGTASGGSAVTNAGSGGHSGAGMAGTAAGGAHAGSAAGGSAGASSVAGSAGSSSTALCDKTKTEYAAELAKQLECKPGAASQCTNRAAAAPGCECRVFIQPADPFAIEHLSNVANAWFDEDCSNPTCPAKCSTAAAGTCQADAKSSLGGRCVSP